MIDIEIIISKDKLDKARTNPITDKAFDAVQHLEWLRNVLKLTHTNGFREMIYY